jgi:hypothetical protein
MHVIAKLQISNEEPEHVLSYCCLHSKQSVVLCNTAYDAAYRIVTYSSSCSVATAVVASRAGCTAASTSSTGCANKTSHWQHRASSTGIASWTGSAHRCTVSTSIAACCTQCWCCCCLLSRSTVCVQHVKKTKTKKVNETLVLSVGA